MQSPLRQTIAVVRDLARRLYVMRRLSRGVAIRVAYLAYSRTLTDSFAVGRPAAALNLRARMERLFEQDWNDAEAGVYPRALLDSSPWRDYAMAMPKLLADLPRTRLRIKEQRFDDLPAGSAERYPRYYARNFHFQTDGYLGHTSAELYDLQVEMLFGGAADAMRRRLVPPVVQFARDRKALGDNQPLRILDVACGTGHLLGQLGATLPDSQLTGVDLSPHYISHARGKLPRALDLSLLVDNAEALPFNKPRFDVVTCLYLFHELPADVRTRVLNEMVRVLKPGGIVVLADSLQTLDAPELAEELRAFPARFHEPYYLSYVKEDLAERARNAGLMVESVESHFLTKVVVARKPLQASQPVYVS